MCMSVMVRWRSRSRPVRCGSLTVLTRVSRVDPSTLAVKSVITVGSGPAAPAAGRGAVWVADQYSGTVSRIDPRRDRVASSVAVGGAPTSLTFDGGRLWVGVPAVGGSHRGGTLVIVTPGPLTSPQISNLTSDPAFYTSANNPQFTGLTWDALVTFQQSTGAGGVRLVPDLAVSIPTPTDGGRTYAFRVRPGIRYSDGQPLLAGDFRRGVQRLFADRSPGTLVYADLVGAGACMRDPDGCNLSQGIVTNDAKGTVAFHFTEPDPEFLDQLTEFAFSAPAPPGTPDREPGQRTVPGTGPYKIASNSPAEIRFVRNPYFREWSHAAQPVGNPNEIVWQSAPSLQAAVTAVEQGRADWLEGSPPLRRVPPARAARPGSAAQQPSVGGCLRADQHPYPAVQRSARQTGAQLRDQPRQARPALRRACLRDAILPGDRARDTRLPPLLPLHAAPPRQRRLERA